MSDVLLFNLSVFLPLALSAAVSLNRCLAQRYLPRLFVYGPCYGSFTAATVFAVFATWMWCFPSGGPSPSPVAMGSPSGTMWAILTGLYAIFGAFIGLLSATTVLIFRRSQFRSLDRAKLH